MNKQQPKLTLLDSLKMMAEATKFTWPEFKNLINRMITIIFGCTLASALLVTYMMSSA